MKNPSEEIVTAWLQECKGFFTMNNIVVPKQGGGKSSEIDILAINGKRNIWVEVAVSTNPRQRYLKETKFKSTISNFLKDFQRPDKKSKVNEIFYSKKHEKWLIHGKLALTKKEKECFPKVMEQKGVTAIYFGNVFNDIIKLKYYRLDSARGYMNLFKTFGNCIHAQKHENREANRGKPR